MTTEPKFIPNEAIEINMEDNLSFKVRLIDCVGYMVDGAMGYLEEEIPRMVKTPWHDYEIPFEQAAEIGTKKVITEHSSIGVVITTDGSIVDIPRDAYIKAEERVVNELKEINKPFLIILNCINPQGKRAEILKNELEEKFRVPVLPLNCAELSISDVNKIFEIVLYEFPLKEIAVNLPKWFNVLENNHWLKKDMIESVKATFLGVNKIRDVKPSVDGLGNNENIKNISFSKVDLGEGKALIDIDLPNELYYSVLSDVSGFEINSDYKLMELIKELGNIKNDYDKIKFALQEVRNTGYGVVFPSINELVLEEPEIVKHGGQFGVRLRASAPSIHMMLANIETEVSPIVGTEKQSEELVNFLMSEFENDKKKIWETNIFGKSLHELVNEGLNNKLSKMPVDAQLKMQETLEKIINEGSGGLICIIL
jgi:stage IV sporulation protein A